MLFGTFYLLWSWLVLKLPKMTLCDSVLSPFIVQFISLIGAIQTLRLLGKVEWFSFSSKKLWSILGMSSCPSLSLEVRSDVFATLFFLGLNLNSRSSIEDSDLVCYSTDLYSHISWLSWFSHMDKYPKNCMTSALVKNGHVTYVNP